MATATQKLVQIGTTANTLAPGARMVIDPDLRDAENTKLDVESATVGDGFLVLSLNADAGTFDVQNIGSIASTCTFTAYAFYSSSLNPTEATSTPTAVASANPAKFLGYAPNWEPAAPPATPNALDDEFNSGTLTGWNDYDFGNVGVNYVDPMINKLNITQTKGTSGPTVTEMTGLYRDAPTVLASDYEYTIWTRTSISTQDSRDFPWSGIFTGVDMSLAVNDMYGLAVIRATFVPPYGVWLITTASFTAWNANPVTIGTVEVIESTHIYLRQRIRYVLGTNTTSIFFDYSSDGAGWKALNGGASVNVTGELKSIGMVVNDENANSGVKTTGFFDFFRVYDGYAFNATSHGALVNWNKST